MVPEVFMRTWFLFHSLYLVSHEHFFERAFKGFLLVVFFDFRGVSKGMSTGDLEEKSPKKSFGEISDSHSDTTENLHSIKCTNLKLFFFL